MIYFFYEQLSYYDYYGLRAQTGKVIKINANAFGYFGTLAIFSAALNFSIKKNLTNKVFLYFIIVLALFVNFYTASRAGLFFVFCAAAICSYLFENKLVLFVMITLLTVLLLEPFLNLVMDSLVIQRFSFYFETGQDLRLIHIKDGISRVLEFPFGYGPGQFSEYDTYSGVSHNTIIFILHDYGLIIFCFVVYMFATVLRNFWNDRNKLTEQNALVIYIILVFLLYSNFYEMIKNAYIYSYLACIYTFYMKDQHS